MTNFKKTLLVGTAVVALGGFAVPASAALDLNGADVTLDETSADPGTVTDTGTPADGNLIIDANDGAGGSTNLTITGNVLIGAAVDGAAGDLTLESTEGAGGDVDAVTVTVTGNINVDNLKIYDGDGNAADDATLNVGGDITATLVEFDDDAGAAVGSTLVLNGSGTQTITGPLSGKGDAAGEGKLDITNTGGTVTVKGVVGNGGAANKQLADITIGGADATSATVVFEETVDVDATGKGTGTILIGQTDGGGATVTFQKAVTGAAITLGTGGGSNSTQTVNFDATGGSYVVTGALSGGNADDTNNINILGGAGKTVTIATAMGNNIDTVDIAAGTKLIANEALKATNFTLGSAAEIETGAAKTHIGDINGAGILDIDHATTVKGHIGNTTGLTTLEIANTKALTLDADGVDRTLQASTITLEGATAELVLTPGAKTITVKNAITNAGTGSEGIVDITNGAGTVVFEGDLGASGSTLDQLQVDTAEGADNIVQVKGNLYVDNIDLDDADQLQLLGSGKTVSGTVDADTAGEGQVIVGNGTDAASYTFSEAVGTTAVGLFKVSSNATATINKSVTGQAADTAAVVDVDGTLNVDVTNTGGDLTIGNGTGGDIDLDGTVSISGTTNNAIIDASTGAGADLFIDGAFTTALGTAGKITSLGSNANNVNIGTDTTKTTTVVAGNQIKLLDNATIGNATTETTINLRKTDVFDPDTVAVVDAVIDANTKTVTVGGTLKIGVDASSGDLTGDTITVIGNEAAGGIDFDALLTANTIQLVDTALLDLQNDTSDATALKVKVVAKDAVASFGNANSGNAANAIVPITGATGELKTIRDGLLAETNTAVASEKAEATTATVDGGNLVATTAVMNKGVQIGQERMFALRDGSATGMSAGNMGEGLGMWGQVFGLTGEQDRRDNVDGYDVDSYGIAVGIDTQNIAANTTLGVSFAYSDTEVDSANANSTNTEIDTYQFALYGMTELDERTWLTGQVTYAHGDNDVRRNNVGGVAGLTASGDFDADTWGLFAELGRDYAMDGGLTVTPSVLANYQYYDPDNYTETGAGTANLITDQDEISIFELGLGVDAAWMFQQADGSYVSPELRAGYRYDFVGDEYATTSTFTGGGAAFQTKGFDPAQSTFDLGAGVTYYAVDNWELTADYTFEFKEDYDAHSGVLRAAYKF